MALQSRYVSHSPLSAQKKHTQNLMYQKLTIQHSSPGYKNLNAQSLPVGWKREEVLLKIGLSTGKSIVFYVSPSGQKVTSPRQLRALLGEKFNIASFDWRSGRFIKSRFSDQNSANEIQEKNHRSNTDFSIFSRRVAARSTLKPTYISMHTDSKNSDRTISQLECPKQMFCEKRLANCQAVDCRTNEPIRPASLPSVFQAAGAPGYMDAQVMQNVILSLADKCEPIIGQDQPISVIEKNPCATLNPSQPYINALLLSDDDIKPHELCVKNLRRKLELARRKFNV